MLVAQNVRTAEFCDPNEVRKLVGMALPIRSALEQPVRTRTQQTHDLIVKAIKSGEFPPGTALDEVRLAARFNVSRTPVREALRLLSSIGLVEIRPHRGAVVAKVDDLILEALLETVGELEASIASLAAVNMTTAERASLREIHRTWMNYAATANTRACGLVGDALHDLVYAGARNPCIHELLNSARLRLLTFSRLREMTADDLSRSGCEHEALIEAIIGGNRAAAADAAREHVVSARSRMRLMPLV